MKMISVPTTDDTTAPAQADPQTNTAPYIGREMPRIDGMAKATGAARYTFDITLPDMVHGTLIGATIPHGRVVQVDASAALALDGVLLVLSVENTPPTPANGPKGKPYVWFDRTIVNDGQDVAFVVATTQAIADETATLIAVTYERLPFVATMDDALADGAPLAGDGPNVINPDDEGQEEDELDRAHYTRGSVADGLSAAAATIDVTYTTPPEFHNPWETCVSVASWSGDAVTVYDSTQNPHNVQKGVAAALGIAQARVRVIAEHVGGGFGLKLKATTQAALAANASLQLGRPVRARLTRAQMTRGTRQRPATRHHIRMGADASGTLTAIQHDLWTANSPNFSYWENAAQSSRHLYACPNVISRHWRVNVNQSEGWAMRGPGSMQNQFALESALDELAAQLGIDPIELRRRNEPTTHISGKPYAHRTVMQCLERGAEMIGWDRRAQPAGSMIDGPRRRGIGVAVAYWPVYRIRAQSGIEIDLDGRVHVRNSSVDIGTGTYTIMAQIAADGIGARIEDVTVTLGDTTLPQMPSAGGSWLASSGGMAVHNAALAAREQIIAAAIALPDGPFAGCTPADLTTSAGSVCRIDDFGRSLPFEAVMRAHGEAISAIGTWSPRDATVELSDFGAHFAEVEVDVETGIVSVVRFVAVHDSGRVLNAKTFRSQLYGGVIWGISAALMEEMHMNPQHGRVANANLWDYIIPTALDIGTIDIAWLDNPDYDANALGAKGAGEVGLTGATPAIANAIYNATGVRLRDLPFRPHRVLPALLG